MKIMGIDYGDSRVGIALSDSLGFMAHGLKTVPNKVYSKMLETVVSLIKEHSVETVVLGLPKNMDGTVGERAEKCLAFSELLKEKTGLPVVMWDERRTTVDAHRILHNNGKKMKNHKKNVDAVAASLILEGYLASI